MNRKSSDSPIPIAKKKRKIEQSAVHLYPGPPVDADDEVSQERILKLLKEEIEKPRPRSDVLNELMRRTYGGRRDSFVNKNVPNTLSEYIDMYPLLKKSTHVSVFANQCISVGYYMVLHDHNQDLTYVKVFANHCISVGYYMVLHHHV